MMVKSIFAFAVLSSALVSTAMAGPRDERSAASSCPPGFAALQSSDTCVRIGGHVRAETIIGSSRSRSAGSVGSYTSGRVQLEVHKPTELGPFRAVIGVGTSSR